VRSIVQAAVDVIEPGAAAKHVVVRVHFDDVDMPVNADADRLQQAVWNVMSNGLKFTPTDGTVDVSVKRNGSTVDIIVADTGQGISSEFLPYVFDRFRQADSSASRRHGGLGLGLALTRQIVELHGGSIDVHSAGIDKGSTFTIRLPIADHLNQTATVLSAELDDKSLAGITVLLVDDSDDGREMLEVALRGYGATVLAVDSAESAVQALEPGRLAPDVLVSDVGMPGRDGYELIRRVRSLAGAPGRIPAIAVTAYADPEDRIHALAAGFQMHLSKPVEPSRVAESVRTVVAAERAQKTRLRS